MYLAAASTVGMMALAKGAAGAEGLPVSAAGSRVAGMVSGVLLAALVAYALFLALAPILKSHRRDFGWMASLLGALLVVKICTLFFFTGFGVDVGTYESWALRMAQGGPATMYQSGYFLDYPPGYLYALWAAGAVARAIGASGDLLRVIVGTPPLLADVALAALSFELGWRLAGRAGGWISLMAIAFNPALLFDTVVWIQSDSGFTLVMLLSVVMTLDDEMEFGWGLAALALLMKPQAVSLVPVLAAWTVLRGNWRRWWREALAFTAVAVLTVAPFQAGRPWSWLPNLYISTAAYYHETSVNAFNFIALIGGVRVNDASTVFGVSYFVLGMALLVPLYVLALWILGRRPAGRNLLFASFIAVFGFFLFAPRMHERYIYPAVVFAVPLALEAPALLAVFVTLTFTSLCNLADVLQILNAGVFLNARDLFGMTISMLNVAAFFVAVAYVCKYRDINPKQADTAGIGEWLAGAWPGRHAPASHAAERVLEVAPIQWTTLEAAGMALIVGIAALLRFWHLGHPAEIVFDEVHFVGQARHYIHSEPFLDPHPPLAKLLIAGGILLFGDHPWSWRLGNAVLGTLLVAVTYLLARRMFRSRLASALAAALIAGDGLFIVDSRIGCIDIVYLTFAAIAYLLLFRFIQTREFYQRKRLLLAIGVVLGLCLGSKLYVPGITFLLVSGFLLFTIWRTQAAGDEDDGDFAAEGPADAQIRVQWTTGAALIVGSLSAIFYLAAFLPHYALGWWGGIADLLHYYKEVMWYENSVATATHPYASPWWSWPLMLRPVAYWQNFPPHGAVATIWGAGNPLTWWAIVTAITITAVRTLEHPNLSRAFILIGFVAYYVIWIPIGRILFLYHYMPSAYIGYLALATVLADMWNGTAEWWEGFALLLTMLPVITIGAGHIATIYQWGPANLRSMAGLPLAAVLFLPYLLLAGRERLANRFVFAAFATMAILLFVYYLPLWLGTPISRDGYYARMWLQGPGLRNWI